MAVTGILHGGTVDKRNGQGSGDNSSSESEDHVSSVSTLRDTEDIREVILRASSFGTIPELEYSEYTVFVFFWELFRFRNERNIIPFILHPIAE